MGINTVKYQYYATICANIISASYGAFCGWPSANFLILQSETETPLENGPMTREQSSWVGAILCIGGLIGNLFFAWVSEKIGRRLALILVAFPALLSWLLIPFATDVNYLLISRFFGGFAGGGAFALVPIYVTEITEDCVRGKMGSYIVLSCNLGILIAFILGNYLSYVIVPLLLALFPLCFLLFFPFLPETPHFLLRRNKVKEAETALRYYRNYRRISQEPPEEFRNEIEKLKIDFSEKEKVGNTPESSPISLSDFNNPIARKAFIIGIGLMALNQFCGIFAMINYTATIFKQAGSNLSPNLSAIIVGTIQLLGSYVSTLLVERAGRKLLITVSAVGTGIGLSSLGLYTYLDKNGYEIDDFNWVPVASFSFTVFLASIGVLTLPFLIVSEIMPPKIRNIGCTVCLALVWGFSFLMLKYLSLLIEAFGMHGTMFFFATCCFTGAIFILVILPETKGKTIEAIMRSLR